jgi:hypothetical protein
MITLGRVDIYERAVKCIRTIVRLNEMELSMYKVVVTDKYKLYIKDKFLEEFNNQEELAEYAFDFIRTEEITEAINWISDTNHNTMEFGFRGYFTISYYDNTMEE